MQYNSSYFDINSTTRKIAPEAMLSLGAARAVLMQLAHPLVALGVSRHSRYMQDPFGRANATLLSSQMLTCGTKQKAHQAAKNINQIHKEIHGTLSHTIGIYPDQTIYDARNPELLLWVHATLIDTVLLTYPLFIGPLTPTEQNQYYQESKKIAQLLGLTGNYMPKTLDDLQQYVQTMIHGNQLMATPEARALAQTVLFPTCSIALRPFLHVHYQITSALLPEPIRAIYGLYWSHRRQRVFNVTATTMRTLLPYIPHSLRIFPGAKRMLKEADSQ